MAPKVAFVTGANGITGSAIIKHLVKHTTAEQWSKIIITSRSPLQIDEVDERITFVALDFSKPAADLEKEMGLTSEVTHAFFSSYVHRDDFAELNTANSNLFENFLTALTNVASKTLENVTLQTGGKHYYVHVKPVPSPARECDPRLPATIDNFYYPQEDFLIQKQRGSKWTYNVIRPEAIIGTTNKPNGMNEALTMAMYFMVQAKLGNAADMPTNQVYWNGVDDVSDSASIAELSVYTATNPRCGNEAFNHTNGDYFQWCYLWPRLAHYFGANVSSDYEFKKPYPKPGVPQQEFSLVEWSQDKEKVRNTICEEAGCPQAKDTWRFGTWAFQDWVFQRSWSATLSVNKARKFGWTHYVDSYDSFTGTFAEFERKGLIPRVR